MPSWRPSAWPSRSTISPGRGGVGAEPRDHVGVPALRHEADVLAVGLLGNDELELACQSPGLVLRQLAEGEAQEVELILRGGVEEVALVARRIEGAVERATAALPRQRPTRDVMAGCEAVGVEVARGGQQVAELDRAVALDAGDRRLAGEVALGEPVDHRIAESVLVVEDVVRDAEAFGDTPGVVDVLAGAAGALAVRRRAVIVKLQGDADDVVALALQQPGHDRGIDAAGHGDDDASLVRRLGKVEGIHGAGSDGGSGLRRSCRPALSIVCVARRFQGAARSAGALSRQVLPGTRQQPPPPTLPTKGQVEKIPNESIA